MYPLRKHTIEMVFVEDKEKHCLRFTWERWLKKNRHRTSMLIAGHNLKNGTAEKEIPFIFKLNTLILEVSEFSFL